MTKKEEQKQEKDAAFLRELKAEINENTDFSCTYPIDEAIVNFIWVKTKDAKIGNLACHYEVIFNDPADGNPNTASVEVHFEDEISFKRFQNIKLPEGLVYAEWGCGEDCRIVYTDKDEDREFSKEEIIGRLKKLDKLIGQDLKDAFQRQIPKGSKKREQREPEFPRNPAVAENAKEYAGYKCEICADHKTFVAKDGTNYMEAHHLIPMAKQDDFENSLDQEQNVVCLCPNCHREIHQGINRMVLVKALWEQRKMELKAAGIGIDLSDLKAYYA